MPGLRHLIYFGISFADPLWGDASDELKTLAAIETSGLLGLFHDPFGGMLQTSSKPMRLLRLRDCWDYFMIPLGGASDELKTHDNSWVLSSSGGD
jgi:hypothetical protein